MIFVSEQNKISHPCHTTSYKKEILPVKEDLFQIEKWVVIINADVSLSVATHHRLVPAA